MKYEEHYSVDDYEKWDGQWELIYGAPYAMSPSPIVTHQFVSSKIAVQLDALLHDCKNCLVLNEVDWEISSDTVLKPDVLVICKKIDEKVNKTPEIIFEVISVATAKRDEVLKFDICQKEGVKYYTLVYPKERVAKVYKLNDDGKFIKQDDFENETFVFTLKNCSGEFDFSKIWR